MRWPTLSVGFIDTTILSYLKLIFSSSTQNFSSSPNFPTRPRGVTHIFFFSIHPHMVTEYLFSLPDIFPFHLFLYIFSAIILTLILFSPEDFNSSVTGQLVSSLSQLAFFLSGAPKLLSEIETIHFLKSADSCLYLKKVFSTMRPREPWKHRE